MTTGGVFLRDILKKHEKLEKIFIERGKIMVMTIEDMTYIFENAEDYEYVRGQGLLRSKMMKAVPGTVYDVGAGTIIGGNDYIVPKFVRFPTDKELELYNNVETV